jgi:hypothetical protein
MKIPNIKSDPSGLKKRWMMHKTAMADWAIKPIENRLFIVRFD